MEKPNLIKIGFYGSGSNVGEIYSYGFCGFQVPYVYLLLLPFLLLILASSTHLHTTVCDGY
jgi:hypothetical protein